MMIEDNWDLGDDKHVHEYLYSYLKYLEDMAGTLWDVSGQLWFG